MKQKYICKCGKVFEKDTDSDTTGYRLGLDINPENECFGCHFIVPIEAGYPNPKIMDYECRASQKINYQTTADIPRDRASFHVAHVHTLDMDFAREIFEYTRTLDGLDDNRKEMDLRGTLYRSDGRYDLGLYFTKTKAGIASSVAVSDKFFGGGDSRPGLTAEQEEGIVLQQIRRSIDEARHPKAKMQQNAPGAVSNGVQNQRGIDQITLEINFYKQQTAQNIIEIGKRLIEAKQQLPHGEWIPWLRDKVDFSVNSADNFMKIAREYSNSQPVGNLPYTKLLALLQVPEADREEFMQETHLVDGQEKTVSEMSKRELQDAIRERDEARMQEKQAREQCVRAEKAANEAREGKRKEYDNYMNALVKAEKAEEALKTMRGNYQYDLQRIEGLEKQIKELESRPVEVAVQEPSETEKQKLRDEGAAATRSLYDRQLNEARRQLEEAKNQARQEMALDPDDIIIASASFKDAMDSAADNFRLVTKIFPASLVARAITDCNNHMMGIVADLRDQAAELRNMALLDEDAELPPADGMEG